MWLPRVNDEVLPLVALPPLMATGKPKLTPSILNCTEPVAALGVIVAVKLTESPNADGFLLDVATVVEAPATIVKYFASLLPK